MYPLLECAQSTASRGDPLEHPAPSLTDGIAIQPLQQAESVVGKLIIL